MSPFGHCRRRRALLFPPFSSFNPQQYRTTCLASGNASDTERQKRSPALTMPPPLHLLAWYAGMTAVAQVSLSFLSAETDFPLFREKEVFRPALPRKKAVMKKGKQRVKEGPKMAQAPLWAWSPATGGDASRSVNGQQVAHSVCGAEPLMTMASTPTIKEEDIPVVENLEFGEQIISFDSPIYPYHPTQTTFVMTRGRASALAAGAYQQQAGIRKMKSIKSEGGIELTGPAEVDGSVESMSSVTLLGDITVRNRIESYGRLDVDGNLYCGSKLKAMGSAQFDGSTNIAGKVKIFGSLQIRGTLVVQDELEVYGSVTINGYMKCKKLTAYSSLTTVGHESWYQVEETENVMGAKLVKTYDYEG